MATELAMQNNNERYAGSGRVKGRLKLDSEGKRPARWFER